MIADTLRPEERHEHSSGLSLSANQFLLRAQSGFRRNAPKGQNVSRRVTAKAVASVDAAGHFTSRVKSLDHLALGVEHLSLGVDLETAHRVVNGRRARCRVERLNWAGKIRSR